MILKRTSVSELSIGGVVFVCCLEPHGFSLEANGPHLASIKGGYECSAFNFSKFPSRPEHLTLIKLSWQASCRSCSALRRTPNFCFRGTPVRDVQVLVCEQFVSMLQRRYFVKLGEAVLQRIAKRLDVSHPFRQIESSTL